MPTARTLGFPRQIASIGYPKYKETVKEIDEISLCYRKVGGNLKQYGNANSMTWTRWPPALLNF